MRPDALLHQAAAVVALWLTDSDSYRQGKGNDAANAMLVTVILLACVIAPTIFMVASTIMPIVPIRPAPSQ